MKEQHFPEFWEKWTALRGVPKLFGFSYREFHSSWLSYQKLGKFRLNGSLFRNSKTSEFFRKLSPENLAPFVPVSKFWNWLRTVPTFVSAHTFCASHKTQFSHPAEKLAVICRKLYWNATVNMYLQMAWCARKTSARYAMFYSLGWRQKKKYNRHCNSFQKRSITL